MQVEWYGQSAFRLTADEKTVFIDPFGDMSGRAGGRRTDDRRRTGGRDRRAAWGAVDRADALPHPRIGFLDTADAFLSRLENVERIDSPRFDTSSLPPDSSPVAVLPAAP